MPLAKQRYDHFRCAWDRSGIRPPKNLYINAWNIGLPECCFRNSKAAQLILPDAYVSSDGALRPVGTEPCRLPALILNNLRSLPYPRRQHRVNRYRRGTRFALPDQTSRDQMRQRALNRPLRNPDQFGEDAVAHGHRFTTRPVRVTVQLQINQKGDKRPAVGDQIAHQCVHNISVEFHPIAKIAIAGTARESHLAC